MAMAPSNRITGSDPGAGGRIGISRHFTTEGEHPYDQVSWERRDSRITNYRDGTVAFEQSDVEVPVGWSLNATNILAQKYFRGPAGTPERETSLRQVADRVVDTIAGWGAKDGYFADEAEAAAFADELKHLIITQRAAFNSPVWFNIGAPGRKQQASACQPYDAMVSTPEGLVPIGRLVEDDAVGTKVYDAHGLTQVVATKANGRKRVRRIHTKAGYTLDVTADHLVWRVTGTSTGGFVQAGTLEAGDRLEWCRTESWGQGDITSLEIAEAALAGWLQRAGFVGRYRTGTNRSLTIEAMTVTDAELEWVEHSLDVVFPGVHRHQRRVVTQDEALDCRRTRLYGEVLATFVERWSLLDRGLDMTLPAHLHTAPLPVVAAYLRSVFQAKGYVSERERAAVIGIDMISEGVVRGVQALLLRFGIFSRVRFKSDRRGDRKGCWSLSIRPLADRRRFADEIGFIDPAKAIKLAMTLELPGLTEHIRKTLEIQRVEDLGEMEVYDIQTESGEYLSGGLRVHNCFILSVDDKMSSILNWYVEEGMIFKGGSGAGVNLSRIRSSAELLKGGGTASGPVSFMRGADASAGTIKSGGATRRAAKMVILNADHPDIEDFIWCKATEERKARVLREAGFDMDLDGKDSNSTQYQNANNSVRVTDEFMQAVVDDADWHLRAVTTGGVVRTVKARDLMRQISQATWECADPGMQFDTTINRWHTAASTGRINGSNPCCFIGETLVATDDGPLPIERIEELSRTGAVLPKVMAFDHDAGAPVRREVVKAWVAGDAAELVEVTTASGARFRCTPEHRFLTRASGYVAARDLAAGASLQVIDGADAVASVTWVRLDEPVAVYDLEVEGTHNFAVVDEGDGGGMRAVVVHNSEYMHLDNSACNLASINLLAFLDEEEDRFDIEGYRHAVEVVFTAQEILVGNADYPTEAIAETSRRFRQLGLGYANLGALLMALGLAYDSDGGRAWAGALTAVLTGHAYATSARTAARMGPFAGYAENEEHMLRVLRMHRDELATIDEALVPAEVLGAARAAWDDAIEWGHSYGVRNSQASVLAPTGTIGLLMDCDTTGVEPDLGLCKMKKLVGGGTMTIVNQTVPRALRRLGYTPAQVDEIVAYIDEHKTILGAPHLVAEHVPVFACSMGDNAIHYTGHIRMMGAVQHWVSGAISKCVVADTLLATADGLIRIGGLHQGEARDTFRHEVLEVASLEGAQKTDAFYYGGTRPVRSAVLRSGHRVTGTANHRLLVADHGGLQWKRLDELVPDDMVATKYGDEQWSQLPARFDDFAPTPPYGCQKSVRVPTEMTTELAFLLGAFAAEGHTSRSNWTVHITNSVASVRDRVMAAWRSEFDVGAVIESSGERCLQVGVASKTVVEFLDYLGCGGNASTKRIPDAVLRSPREMVLAFLRGLALDAYVSVSAMSKWAICLDSPKLLDDLQAVLTNLGIVHGRISKWNPLNAKSYGEVYATGEQAQRLVRLVPFLEPDKAGRAEALLNVEFSGRHNTADVVPGISPYELYRCLPEDRSGRHGHGVRSEFAYLCDPRTWRVSRCSLERVAAVPGARLPQWLVQVLADDLHFSPVESVLDAGEREVFDVSVPATQAFVGNGIVNHNTVNMPEDVSVDDIEQLHIDAWRLGIKAVAIYRDNCKVAQPLSMAKKEVKTEELVAAVEQAMEVAPPQIVERIVEKVVKQPVRQKLPRNRRSRTFEFRVADCKGFVTVGEYDDGRPGELFLRVSKQGSTLAGIMDAFAISVSHGLQYGVPLKAFIEAFTNMRFEPAGMTDDADIRFATSLVDYIFRRLAVDYLPMDERMELGILSVGERHSPTLPGIEEATTETIAGLDMTPTPPSSNTAAADLDPMATLAPPVPAASMSRPANADAPYCMQCGVQMIRAGSCHACPSCGSTSGCS